MKLSRAAAILLRQYYLFRGSPARLMPIFVWASVDVILWGFITRYLNTAHFAGGGSIPLFLGAIVLWSFMTRVMQGVVQTFFEDVWSRNFLNVFATPITALEYIAGLAMSGFLCSVIGFAIVLLIASAGFGLSLTMYGAVSFAYLVILLMVGLAIGIFGASLALRLGPSVEWLVWPIPAVLSPFACVFYPLAVLPVWMQGVARSLPLSYVFEGTRQLLQDGSPAVLNLLIGFVLAAFYLALSIWTFTRVYRYAIRTGLIARYSAESVN